MIKSITTLVLLLSIPLGAQINPIDFESDGHGADWTWTVFENESNPDLLFVPNPFPSGINTSAIVAEFTALQGGAPFAGCETMHGADIGTFSLDPTNAFVSVMIYKSVISDVGFKFVTPSGASTGEIKIANSLVNEWERLVFDFTAIIGEPSSNGIDQIVIFPDFQNRSSTNVIYFDNIIFGDSSLLSQGISKGIPSTVMWPNPGSKTLNFKAHRFIENISIVDVLGRTVLSEKPTSYSTVLDISSLPEGFYWVLLSGDNQQESQKLIIERP